MKRKYVYVSYDKKSQEKLRKWCLDNGFDLSIKHSGEKQNPDDFNFHTTVLYSVNETDLKDGIIDVTRDNKVFITGMKHLGENLDVAVLLVMSPGLSSLRKMFEAKGLIDYWSAYLPHITVSYSTEIKDISSIALPDFTVEFDQLIIEDLEE